MPWDQSGGGPGCPLVTKVSPSVGSQPDPSSWSRMVSQFGSGQSSRADVFKPWSPAGDILGGGVGVGPSGRKQATGNMIR